MPIVHFPSTYRLRFSWFQPKYGFGGEISGATYTPESANILLGRLDRRLKDTTGLVEATMPFFKQDMELRFQTETDPEGRPWMPLVKEAPEQQGILQLTGALREAAVSDQAWIASPVGVFFNTAALPEYWIYHDQPERSAQFAAT